MNLAPLTSHRLWAIFHFVCYEVPDAVSFVTGACSPAIAGISFAAVIVQSRLTWPQAPCTPSDRRMAEDQLQFSRPRVSNVYSIGLSMADAVREIEDAGDPKNAEPSELSSETREVKPDSPLERGVM